MSYILLLVSVLLLAAVDGKPSTFEDGRIVGGNATTIESRPYQVSLQYYGWHICGGSILSPTKVITAAHCTNDASETSLSIRAGSTFQGSGGIVIGVSEIYQHYYYNSRNFDFDISVLTLSQALEYSPQIQAITLPSYRPPNGTPVIVSGWGTLTQGGCSPLILQQATVNIISQQTCRSAYGSGAITDRMICAGVPDGGVDSCQGDSGGPLVRKLTVGWELVGVVSWGNGCALKGFPGVYADVFELKDFL